MGSLDDLPRDRVLIGDYAEPAYLAYAVMSVKERALPMVQDGQKPVQKRILYSMWNAGQKSDAKHVKCARVVGDVLGRLHPHGDSSVYDAMVRLAQEFTLRYPLMDGQGNFGSLDGDSAAAMRYTEIRLSPIAELLLAEVNSGTVDFIDNYDGSFQEPSVLPARLPFALLNGAAGVAVGMACTLPSHNLREVAAACIAWLRNPEISVAELLSHMPGPDFAGGGKLISAPSDILSAYESGRGTLRARAHYEIEELARGQWQLVFTQFPPDCSARKVLQDLDALADPKLKDPKKDKLKPEQVATRALVLSLIDAARDESDKNTAVRLVIEPKTSKIDKDELLAFLFANTCLEVSVPLNLTVVGRDGNPARKNLQQLIGEWAQFRFDTVTRRSQHRLQEVNDRLHILAGRQIALLHIDEVIRVIRESDEPKSALMASFGLTEIQAQDILEIRLRQLARLEWIKLEKEIEGLNKEKAGLEKLLGSETAMKAQIIKEISADAAKYGDDRRTLLEEALPASAGTKAPTVADEPITVILSKNGWLRARVGHNVDLAQLTFKPGDSLMASIETRTVHPLVFLDHQGRAYSVLAADAPTGRGDGVPITSLLEVQNGGKLRHMLSADPQQKYLFAGRNGYGFISELQNLVARPKAGKAFLTLDDGEEPMPPLPLPENAAELQLAVGSSAGRLLIFPLGEMKALDKGKGVKLANLETGATLSTVLLMSGAPIKLCLQVRGRELAYNLTGEDYLRHCGKRAGKGALLPKQGTLIGEWPEPQK